MGADEDRTRDPQDRPPPADDLPAGPVGWEAFRVRSLLDRVDVLRRDPDADLPPPSDRERLAADVLTALFGPIVANSVPERLRDDPEAVAARERRRERDARAKRRAAVGRLADRFPYPVHPGRWKALDVAAAPELARRHNEEDGRTPWWMRPNARREAVERAVFLALSDGRVLGAEIDDLEAKIRTAVEDVYGTDVVGPDWSVLSRSADDRRRRRLAEDHLATRERVRLTKRPAREAELRMARATREARVESRAEELTAAQRAVYRPRKLTDMTYEEIGAELGISADAAKMRMQRARERLGETA